MKKGIKYFTIAWFIVVIAFHIIVFAVANSMLNIFLRGASYWLCYGLVMFVLLGEYVCTYIALNTDENRQAFLNLPLISISYGAVVATAFFGAFSLVSPSIPNAVAPIGCLVILAWHATQALGARAAATVVSDIDDRVKVQTVYIKMLTADAESLMARANSPEEVAATKKVYEAVRYSDPMSNEHLIPVETQITQKFNELNTAVSMHTGAVEAKADELLLLINDRNNKCKVLK